MSGAVAKIGVTGASGVLGRSLRALADFVPFEGDITSLEETRSWITHCAQSGVRSILHLAALVPTQSIEEAPQKGIEVNTLGTCHLLTSVSSLANQGYKPWLFIASTSHVYASSDEPVDENSPTDPVSLYGLSKLHAEQWAERLSKKAQLPLCVGRIFSYSSPLQAESYFLPGILHKLRGAESGSTLSIPGLAGKRDLWSAEEVAKAILFLEQKQAVGVFNLASGEATVLRDVVHVAKRLLRREDVQIDEPDRNSERPVHLVADTSKLVRLGFETHRKTLESLVQSVIDRPSSALGESKQKPFEA